MQFSAIPGQEGVKTGLLNASNYGRLPHALLFYGPEGNGGMALALAMATYLLCENRTDTDSCGHCDSCSKTKSLVHPDLHFSFPTISTDGSKLSDVFIKEWRKVLKHNPFMSYNDWMEEIKNKDDQNKQGNITAEECREIIKKLSLKSFEGGKKFMIIWLPEFLGLSGNILLKLLEEPPAETHFILVAEDINQVLPTILSRTQIINIPAFTTAAVATFLTQTNQISEAEATAIAYLSKGNLGLAQHLIHEEDTSYTEDMRVWMGHCYTGNMGNLNEWVNKMAANGREKIKNFLENSLYIFGECLHCRLISDYAPRVPSANEKFVRDFSKILDETKVERIYKDVNDTIFHIERNASAKISLFNLSLNVRHILVAR